MPLDALQGLNQKWLVVEDGQELFRKIGLTQRPETLAPSASEYYCEFLN